MYLCNPVPNTHQIWVIACLTFLLGVHQLSDIAEVSGENGSFGQEVIENWILHAILLKESSRRVLPGLFCNVYW